MKRIITIALAVLAFATAASCQTLRRDILGIRIGKTTIAEAEKIMVKKGYTPIEGQYYRNVVYGGVVWDCVAIRKWNESYDTVCHIALSKGSASYEYKQLYNILKEKYRKYIVSERDGEIAFRDRDFFISLNLFDGDDLVVSYSTEPKFLNADAF